VALVAASACAASPHSPFETARHAAIEATEAPVPRCGPARADALRDGVVTIRPGETVCVAAVATGDVVDPVGVVTSDGDATARIVLRSWRKGDGVFLTIHNPFSRFLKYRAGMLLPGEARHRATSSCPVLGNRLSLEHWPHPVDEISLAGFRLLPDGAALQCD
jgi:hypothetical protein